MPRHGLESNQRVDPSERAYAKRGLHLISNFSNDRRAELEFIVKEINEVISTTVTIEDEAFNADMSPYTTAFAVVMPLDKVSDILSYWWAIHGNYRDDYLRNHQS